MGTMQRLATPNADEDIEQQKLIIIGGTVTVKECLGVSCKAKHSFITQFSKMLLGIYRNELKTQKTCIQRLKAALFISTQTWKKPNGLQ